MSTLRPSRLALRPCLLLLTAALAGIGPPVARGAAATAPEPDVSGYQEILDQFLTVTSAPGAPLETRFDYAALRRSKDSATRFATVRKQLFGVQPSALSADARKAWAINAYNYLVLETVAGHLYESTHRRTTGGKRYFYGLQIASVQTIQLEEGGFFESAVVEIEGVRYSLNAFERTFVFEGWDPAGPAKRPATLDPRAHFALVCAAKGCPPLMPRAYRADSIDGQLDVAVRNALSSKSHLRIDSGSGRLEASSIFDWYRGDFGGTEGAFAFLRKHAPAELRGEIERRKIAGIHAYILWDWGLNSVEPKAEQAEDAEKASG